MQRYLLIRVLQAMITLLAISVVIFVLARATGDPVLLMLPPDASAQDAARLRQALGLDKPLVEQYWIFLSGVAHGDLGESLRSKKPVTELIGQRLPNTVKLGGFSMAIAVLLASILGVVAAVKRGTPIDVSVKIVAVLGQSLPVFWLGIVLIDVFAVRIRLLPASGTGDLTHYVLPGLCLGWFVVAGMMRLLRSSMLDTLDTEFVKLARVKGVPERWVILKHALRNALIPVVTFAGMYLAQLITGTIIVETVFAWPGLGRLAYESVLNRDFPVIQGVVLVVAAIIVFINLMVDVLYAYIDPRIRYG